MAYAVSLTVTEDGLEADLSAAVQSLEYINTWLTWSVAQRHSDPDVNSDALASCILALSSNVIVNKLFTVAAQCVSTDSDLLFCIGSIVKKLVNIPGVLAFTTASEALARAASCNKSKEKEPLVPPGPSAPPSCLQHFFKHLPSKPLTPIKLTVAWVVALAAHLPASTPLGKQKNPLKKEALVSMARVFPSANTVSFMNAQAAVSGDPPCIFPAKAACIKRKCFTTHGQSCHQVVVYASLPTVLKVDKVMNQINDLLVKSKQAIYIILVEET